MFCIPWVAFLAALFNILLFLSIQKILSHLEVLMLFSCSIFCFQKKERCFLIVILMLSK